MVRPVSVFAAALALCGAAGCEKQAAAPTPSSSDLDATLDSAASNEDGGAETGVGASYPLLPAVPFHTQSRWIMDSANNRFKLAGVSWYGAESQDLVPMGLDRNDIGAIAHLVKTLGFNSVRIPWANQLYEQNPVVDASLLSANPALQGQRALDVLDAVIDAVAREGLVVILDNHRSRGDWCCDTAHGDGLWHTAQYPESAWIADWVGMVNRYAGQPAVVAVDLRNEIRGELPDDAATYCADCDNPPDAGCGCWQPSWGDNNALTDWAAAAERGGNAILQANPSLLVIVEGDFWATWFGANYRPVKLAVGNRLVYSPHNYASSNGGAGSFADYAAFKSALDSAWGYLVQENQPFTAPVWVGEFGTNQTALDTDAADVDAATSANDRWWIWIRTYMSDLDLDWSVWALNGTQGPGYGRTFGAPEGFGVLLPDWKTPAPQPFLQALQDLQSARLAPAPAAIDP